MTLFSKAGSLVGGPRSIVRSLRVMVSDAPSDVRGPASATQGRSSLSRRLRSIAHGPRSMVHGPWSIVRRSSSAFLLVAALTALAFGLRVYHLADANIWFDEGFSTWVALDGPITAAGRALHDTHPPLFYWLLWLWSIPAGESAFGLRFLAVLAGTLTVPLGYRIGQSLGGSGFGVLLAALLATSRFAIDWSQQVRMYALAGLLIMLVLYLWWRTLPTGSESRVAGRGSRVAGPESRARQPCHSEERSDEESSSQVATTRSFASLRMTEAVQMTAGQGATPQGAEPKPRNPESGSPDSEPGTRDPGPGTRNPGLGTRDSRPATRNWLWYGLAVGALGNTLYLALLAPALLALASVLVAGLGRGSRRYWRGWLLAHGLAAALVVPWALLRVGLGSPPRLTTIAQPDLRSFLEVAASAVTLGVLGDLDRVKVIAVALLALALGGIGYAWTRRSLRPMALVAALLLVVPPALLFALSRPNPIFFLPNLFVRYLVIFIPGYLLGLAWALTGLTRRSWLLGGLVGALVLAATGWTLRDYYQSRYLTDDYQSIVGLIEAYGRPGDQIVLYSDKEFPVFQFHYRGELPLHRLGTEVKLTPELAAGQGSAAFSGHPNVWVVTIDDGKDADPEGHFRGWLRTNARDLLFLQVHNRSVNLYTVDPAETRSTVTNLAPDQPLAVPLSPEWELVGYDQPLRRVARGDAVRLGLYLRARRPVAEVPMVEMDLTDRAGTPYRSVRRPLVGDWFAPFEPGQVILGTVEMRIVEGIPGGRYDLRLRLVDSDRPAPVDHRLGPVAILSDRGPAPQPPPAAPIDRPAADGIWLFGYDRLDPVRPAQTTTVELVWRASHANPLDLQSYVRLIGLDRGPGPNDPVWAARYQPVPGDQPTTTWVPGQVVRDTISLDVPAVLPPGRYRLEAGLYDPMAKREQHGPITLWEGSVDSS